MIEISSASIAFCLVLILVGLLLVVLYFCEFGPRGRGEMMEDSYSNVLTTVVEENCNKSKFMTRWEVPWPLREATRKTTMKQTMQWLKTAKGGEDVEPIRQTHIMRMTQKLANLTEYTRDFMGWRLNFILNGHKTCLCVFHWDDIGTPVHKSAQYAKQ